jgi:NCAIR mutase (PurE)-related protein
MFLANNTYALTTEQYKIYKEVNVWQDYIEDNFKNGKKLNEQIQELFRVLRKNKDTSTITKIQDKMKKNLEVLRAKNTLTKQEQKIYKLVEHLFYRSYIELLELR